MSSKSAKSVNSAKGRRYTIKEKQDILQFVDNFNESHGRGGQNAASKKFKISPLTISNWKKSQEGGMGAGSKKSSDTIGKKLAKLEQLHIAISQTEKEISKLRAQFDSIKASI